MQKIRRVRTAVFLSLALAGPCISVGCGQGAVVENGKQVVEDPKVATDRSNMIQDMYKTKMAKKSASKK